MSFPDKVQILSRKSVHELLQDYSAIMLELQKRQVLRTKNNPVADYTEWMVANTLNLRLADNSSYGYDAIGSKGELYQIKGRRVNANSSSVRLSAIRNLAQRPFDYLIAVVFEYDFSIRHAVKVPVELVREKATFQQHTNSHIFHVCKSLLQDKRSIDIKSLLVGNLK